MNKHRNWKLFLANHVDLRR